MAGFATNGGSVIAPANEFWHNPNVGGRTQNLRRARDLLGKAGYSWDDDGKLLYPA
jgi:peptide/nickel transport system substrate-binding protein